MNRLLSVAICTVWLVPACLQAATIAPLEDVMTSRFFTGADLVRGYAGDNRPTFRVSSNDAFGVTGAETIYIAFDPAAFSGFTTPIARAVLTVQSKNGGFGANAAPASPFIVSAHGVTADPLTGITDDANPSGPISWLDFFNNNILAADPAALTSVEGFGPVTFNVTSLVNDWLSGVSTVFALALTGKNDTSGNDFLHGFQNNTEIAGSTFLTVTQVPEPASLLIVLVGGVALVAWILRPARLTHGIQ